MTAPPEPRIACPNCGKQYKWKTQIAGRKVQCSQCEQKMRLPDTAEGAIEPIGPLLNQQNQASHGAYELDLPEEEPTPASSAPPVHMDAGPAGDGNGHCPACNSKLKPGAVLCINCGYHVEEGKKIKTSVAQGAPTGDVPKSGVPTEKGFTGEANPLGSYAAAASRMALDSEAMLDDMAQEQRRKDFVIPLILIAIAAGGLLLNAFVLQRFVYDIHVQNNHEHAVKMAQAFGSPPPPPPQYGAPISHSLVILLSSAIRLIIQIPLLLAALFIVARLFGSSYGRITTAMLKLPL